MSSPVFGSYYVNGPCAGPPQYKAARIWEVVRIILDHLASSQHLAHIAHADWALEHTAYRVDAEDQTISSHSKALYEPARSYTSGFTMLGGFSPLRVAMIFSAAIRAMAFRVSREAEAMWG